MQRLDLRKEILSEKERRSIDILEIVRRRGPISRPDISKEMGINVVTISNYVDEFIRRNVVYEKELDISEGGRRPVLVDLNAQSGYVIGVGLNLLNMVGVLVDLKGNIVTKAQVSRPKTSVKEVSDCLLDIVRELLRRSKEYTPHIKGIGVGIAGLINKTTGAVCWPQKGADHYTYASVEVPLQELIEKEFDIPTLIENDATSACFGEHWLDLERGYKNVLYMFSGVGCGIMMNGELYRGANGYAGELSIYNHRKRDIFKCSLGQQCLLQPSNVDLGMAAELAAGNGHPDIDLKGVFDAVREGNARAKEIVKNAAFRLGVKVAFLVNLLNPEIVVIGGGLEEAGEEFLNTVNTTVREWAFREASGGLDIAFSQLRENAVALGAASLVTQKMFAQLW